MSSSRVSSGSRLIFAIAALLVLYVLSVGPLEAMYQHDLIPSPAMSVLEVVYAPINWIGTFEAPKKLLSSYIGLFP